MITLIKKKKKNVTSKLGDFSKTVQFKINDLVKKSLQGWCLIEDCSHKSEIAI